MTLKKNQTPQPFWVSWYCVDAQMGKFELHWPWWITGYASDDSAIICAAVRAADKYEAMGLIIKAHDGPVSDIRWRFIERQPVEWSPFDDRFQQADWMRW